MTQPQYIISTLFRNQEKEVDSIISWYERANRHQRRVLLYLKGYLLNCASVFPGQKLIADKTGYSVRQIQRILVTMREAGILVWKRRAYTSCEYFLDDKIKRINFTDPALFRKNVTEVMNKSEVVDAIYLGKCRNMWRDACPPNNSTNRERIGVQNVGSSSLFYVNNMESVEEKRALLASAFVTGRDAHQFMDYSLKTIGRASMDVANRHSVYRQKNWVASMTSTCYVYHLCETQNIDPKAAWAIYHAQKQTKHKRAR